MSDVFLDTNSVTAFFQSWRQMMKQRNDSMSHLLMEADSIIRSRTQDLKHDFQRLLSECKGFVNRIENDRKISAARFNIFDALGVTRKEIVQSRFLAFLLSPLEHHDQGTTFLNAFLQKIGVPTIADKKGVRVRTEVPADKFGRMDIVISTSSLLIVVENKVDSGEGEQQLARYQEWMKSQTGQANKVIVFLTPTGFESMTGESRSLSYAAIAEAFEVALSDIEAVPVCAVMKQYIACCRSITTGGLTMTSPNKDLINHITQPGNIKVALELEQQTAFARKTIASEFCRHITKFLTKFLGEPIEGDPALNEKWRVQGNVQGSAAPYEIAIVTKGHNPNRPNYRLRAEYIFSDAGKGWVGWNRPQYVDLKQPQETASLSKKMFDHGCNGAENAWVGSRPLRGSKGYVLSDNDDIFACFEDNRSAEHPLAREMAEEMWEMFRLYRADIESLDSFKKEDSR